jgi:hypothetical protein
MCELTFARLYVSPNRPRLIDPIFRPPDNGKHHFGPIYDFVASIVYNRVGRVRCFSGESQTRCFVCCRRAVNGVLYSRLSIWTPSEARFFRPVEH